jgi:branched-chain amino acid aminotransferase
MIGFVDEVDGPLLSTSPVSLTIAAIPYGSYFAAGEKGLNCCVNSWGRISDNVFPPRLKAAANYHNSRLGGIQAKKDGYDGSIFLNQNGKVTEAEGSNFFMVRKGTPITPGITCNILEGITRSTLIRLFDRELHLQVIEREIDRTELYVAEEAFLCGSAAEVTPIISIDRRKVGDGKFGPVTEKIRKTYFDLVRGKLNGYEDWLLPVYKTK